MCRNERVRVLVAVNEYVKDDVSVLVTETLSLWLEDDDVETLGEVVGVFDDEREWEPLEEKDVVDEGEYVEVIEKLDVMLEADIEADKDDE